MLEVSRCHVLLKNEANFPWFIIVPEVDEGIEDLHVLDQGRFDEIMKVVRQVSVFVEDFFTPEKLNFGCIGNQVRQMHLHVIGRSEEDSAWPGVVWGANFEKETYQELAIIEIKKSLRAFMEVDAE